MGAWHKPFYVGEITLRVKYLRKKGCVRLKALKSHEMGLIMTLKRAETL
jgi:hypothetical protein